ARDEPGLLIRSERAAERLLAERSDEALRARVLAVLRGIAREDLRDALHRVRGERLGRRLVRLREERGHGQRDGGVREVAYFLVGWEPVGEVRRIAEQIADGVVVLGACEPPQRPRPRVRRVAERRGPGPGRRAIAAVRSVAARAPSSVADRSHTGGADQRACDGNRGDKCARHLGESPRSDRATRRSAVGREILTPPWGPTDPPRGSTPSAEL